MLSKETKMKRQSILILGIILLSAIMFGTGYSAESTVPMDINSTYLLGVQDVISISVWQRPEFANKIPVRPDGKISVELIGDVTAAGLTPIQLAESIQTTLAEYVKNPKVTITLNEFKSKKVIVDGEVRKPGAVIIHGRMTGLEAVEEAGSFTNFADLKKAVVVRGDPVSPQIIPLPLDRIIKKGESNLDIYLHDGDIVLVPPKGTVKFGYGIEALTYPLRVLLSPVISARYLSGL